MHHDQAITQKITIRAWTNSPPQQQITQNCTNNIKNSLQIYTNNNNNTNNINKYISQQAITPKSQPTSNKYLHHNKQSLKNHNQHQQIHTITCNHSNLHQHQQKHTHTHTPHKVIYYHKTIVSTSSKATHKYTQCLQFPLLMLHAPGLLLLLLLLRLVSRREKEERREEKGK